MKNETIRFFTLKEIEKKIDESGYKIIKHGRRFSQKDDGTKSFLDKMNKCSLIDDSFNFEAYQWLFIIKNKIKIDYEINKNISLNCNNKLN